MNFIGFTGYLRSEPTEGYTPATATAAAIRKLTMDVWLRDSRGAEFPQKCECDDQMIINRQAALLTPGRTVIIAGEITGREFVDAARQKGWVRIVRIHSLEIPDRAAKAA